jgi:signal transduction histidine kinase
VGNTSRSALPFRLFIEQTPTLPEKVHIGFYRIAQEALNNVTKHAQASQVTLSLSATPLTQELGEDNTRYEVRLVIEDDGVGFSSQDETLGNLGLGIMRERAADIQASLTIDSQIGQGTHLELTWCGVVKDD